MTEIKALLRVSQFIKRTSVPHTLTHSETNDAARPRARMCVFTVFVNGIKIEGESNMVMQKCSDDRISDRHIQKRQTGCAVYMHAIKFAVE